MLTHDDDDDNDDNGTVVIMVIMMIIMIMMIMIWFWFLTVHSFVMRACVAFGTQVLIPSRESSWKLQSRKVRSSAPLNWTNRSSNVSRCPRKLQLENRYNPDAVSAQNVPALALEIGDWSFLMHLKPRFWAQCFSGPDRRYNTTCHCRSPSEFVASFKKLFHSKTHCPKIDDVDQFKHISTCF